MRIKKYGLFAFFFLLDTKQTLFVLLYNIPKVISSDKLRRQFHDSDALLNMCSGMHLTQIISRCALFM